MKLQERRRVLIGQLSESLSLSFQIKSSFVLISEQIYGLKFVMNLSWNLEGVSCSRSEEACRLISVCERLRGGERLLPELEQ